MNVNYFSGNMTPYQASKYLEGNTMPDIEHNENEINNIYNILSPLSKIDSLILVWEN